MRQLLLTSSRVRVRAGHVAEGKQVSKAGHVAASVTEPEAQDLGLHARNRAFAQN